jgi:hypothetical protein
MKRLHLSPRDRASSSRNLLGASRRNVDISENEHSDGEGIDHDPDAVCSPPHSLTLR